jgi:hypothetical protein
LEAANLWHVLLHTEMVALNALLKVLGGRCQVNLGKGAFGMLVGSGRRPGDGLPMCHRSEAMQMDGDG